MSEHKRQFKDTYVQIHSSSAERMNLPDLTCRRPAGWNPRRFPHPWATLWDVSAALLYLRRRVVESPQQQRSNPGTRSRKVHPSAWPLQDEANPRTSKCTRQPHTRTAGAAWLQAVDRRPLRAAAATGAEQRLKTNLPLSTVEVQDLFLFCGALVSALFGVLH
jgi:hypothetical protein